MILTCTCKHDFQDKTYGLYRRVFNPRKTDGEYRCTVCGKVQTFHEKKKEVEKPKGEK